MTIKVGDKIPSVTLRYLTPEGVKAVTSDEFFAGKKVALFAVPGAYTRTCSQRHLPGYVTNAAELKAKGVDTIACSAVNDAVCHGRLGQGAQRRRQGRRCSATAAASSPRRSGSSSTAARKGMGIRSQRYSMLVDNGVVKALHVEHPGEFDVSSAEAMLEAL